MNLSQKIDNAFGNSTNHVVTDEFIECNPNLMEVDGDVDLMIYVPAYMKWSIKYGEEDGNLVSTYTLSCLSEYGRSKDPAIKYLNFKHRCNLQQKAAVVSFLEWCINNFELIEPRHIERAIKRWQ